MKGIYKFAANSLSYIPTKYYCNRSTSDLVIAKSKRVNFFETQCIYTGSYLLGEIASWSYGLTAIACTYNKLQSINQFTEYVMVDSTRNGMCM